MKLDDLANLISVRNFAVSILQDRSILSQQEYKQMVQKVRDFNVIIKNNIFTLDLDSVTKAELSQEPEVPEELAVKRAAKKVSKKTG